MARGLMEIKRDRGMTGIHAGFAEDCRVELHVTNACVARARLIYDALWAQERGTNQMQGIKKGW
ncbi:MAG: hypothetical protein STSR0009_06890 [Methanoregula sp.]